MVRNPGARCPKNIVWLSAPALVMPTRLPNMYRQRVKWQYLSHNLRVLCARQFFRSPIPGYALFFTKNLLCLFLFWFWYAFFVFFAFLFFINFGMFTEINLWGISRTVPTTNRGILWLELLRWIYCQWTCSLTSQHHKDIIAQKIHCVKRNYLIYL